MHYNVTHSEDNEGKDVKRNSAITVRLSDEERRALDDVAQDEDIPVAQIIRRAIKGELERIQPTHPKNKKTGG